MLTFKKTFLNLKTSPELIINPYKQIGPVKENLVNLIKSYVSGSDLFDSKNLSKPKEYMIPVGENAYLQVEIVGEEVIKAYKITNFVFTNESTISQDMSAIGELIK